MQILTNKTKSKTRILLSCHRHLYRIGLDTYTVIETANGSELPLLSFKCKKFSAIINNIAEDIIHIGIQQNYPDHLRLTLHVDGREVEYDSTKPYKRITHRNGPLTFELNRWFPQLPNECPFDRMLATEDFISEIRKIKTVPAEQILTETWDIYEADHKSESAKAMVHAYEVLQGRIPFSYISMRCGRAIFMPSYE